MAKYLDIDGLRTFFTDLLTKFDGRYYKQSQIDEMLGGKSDVGHNHDTRYYTESEIDDKLALKANIASPTFTGTPKAPTPDGSSLDAITNVGYVLNKVNSIGNATESSAGLMSANDKKVVDGTQIVNIPMSSFTIGVADSDFTTSSKAYMFNRVENTAMIALDLLFDIGTATQAGASIISGLPKSVGNPAFLVMQKGAQFVTTAYLNANGFMIVNDSLPANKRYYVSVVYCCSDATHFLPS